MDGIRFLVTWVIGMASIVGLFALPIAVLGELRRIGTGENVSPDLLETIRLMTVTLKGLQEESTWKQKKR